VAELIELSDESFEAEVLESTTPVLVDFWGDHCPACVRIAPILQELADEYGDRVKILKLHAAENMATSAKYGIRSMPTVLGFESGQVQGQLQGARPKSDFEELIQKMLGS
jgi:thioredoxin 1